MGGEVVMQQSFQQSLQFGQIGESYIAMWFRCQGYHVLPVYEKQIDTGKGPRLFMASACSENQLVAPDMLAMLDGKFLWVEAKRKSRFTWYGHMKQWETGIDRRHYHDYLRVAEETGLEVMLMFLHELSDTWPDDVKRWGAPATCPTGLYGNKLSVLKNAISHESDKHGSTGMMYWCIDSLNHYASIEHMRTMTPTFVFGSVSYSHSTADTSHRYYNGNGRT